jgi:hypothetical protein
MMMSTRYCSVTNKHITLFVVAFRMKSVVTNVVDPASAPGRQSDAVPTSAIEIMRILASPAPAPAP